MKISCENINMVNCRGTNCYILRGSDGDILIDTGFEKDRAFVEKWLENYQVKLIILTHGHFDHVGNAAYFKEKLGAKIAMNRHDFLLSQDNMIHALHPVSLMGMAYVKATGMGKMAPKIEPFLPDIVLNEGDSLEKYGVDAMVVDLQGHTRGSIGILSGGDLYCGDALVNTFFPAPPAIAESPKHTYATIEYIKNLRPERILFGHGNPVGIDEVINKLKFSV